MPKPNYILRVAVARPLYQLLDYLPIEDFKVQCGSRVRVPLGYSECTGIIIDIVSPDDITGLKQITAWIDDEPLYDTATLKLIQWTSQYYHHPMGEVAIKGLPVLLRGQRKVPKTKFWTTVELSFEEQEKRLGRATKQRELYQYIANHTEAIDFNHLRQHFPKNISPLITQLEKKGLIAHAKSEFVFQYKIPTIITHEKIQLTTEQENCLAEIKKNNHESQPKPILLHGITGSGKTEIYCQAIKTLIEDNKQILIIVPEIGLTPQLHHRFEQFFPNKHVVIMHSGLADGDRMNAWLGAQSGQVDILIGTRSSIFVPMPRLAMIIIDEEHDSSLKQQENFYYHARDIAIKRAHDLSIGIILGSATPSLESLKNSEQGRYHYLRLNKRPGARQSPHIQIEDIRSLSPDSSIGPRLRSEIKNHLTQGNQVMLFLNRRGFAPTLYCPSCGWHAQCQQCDSNMTYHASSQQLICHRCDAYRPVDQNCPSCNNSQITTQGQGTERIEQQLQSYFPTTKIVRIDRDTTVRRGQLESKLAEVHQGTPVILIGTQMLAKGHDFPNLTLVGILDVDQSLFSTDFRAWEKLSQLIIQVSGRAGRADKKGSVILQSTQPDHPFFNLLLGSGYLAVARQSLQERKAWHFPPYAQQALIRANAIKLEYAIEFLDTIKALLQESSPEGLEFLGAAPSPIEKRANRYRAQLLINAKTRKHRYNTINQLLSQVSTLSKKGQLRWSIDIDPIDYS